MIEYIKNNFKFIIVQAIGPALGLISFLVYTVINNSETINYPFAITIGLAITVIVNIPANVLSLKEFQEDSKKETIDALNVVNEKIDTEARSFREWSAYLQKNRFKIEQIGYSDLNKRIDSSIMNADLIKNTYVNLYKVSGVRTSDGEATVCWYNKFLNMGSEVKWIDIVGVQDFLDGRYFSILPEPKEGYGTHEIHIISDSLPIINFMIFMKDGIPTEVYFGWLMDNSSLGDVYHSVDQRMISMFERYFDLLNEFEKDGLIVDHSKEPLDRFKNLVVDKVRGTWFSVSTSNSIKNPSDYSKFSIIKIFVHNGRWVVSGTVYERRSRKIIHEIRSVFASVFEDGIFYQFERTNADGGSVVRGHGTYRITTSDINSSIGIYIAIDDKKRAVQNLRSVKVSSLVGTENLKLNKRLIDAKMKEIQASINRSVSA